MIKRVYPRMSTADFVARAVAIHGDLYDYSESVYDGLKTPFTFLCKRCGSKRTLSQSGTHIRKNKPCGCKPCNSDRLSPCRICGVGVSSKVYHRQQKRCKSCCENAKALKAKNVEAKHGKHCKTCGAWFVYKGRFYCSTECKQLSFAKPVEFTCQHCGKQSTRDPHRIKNPDRMFCNKECQSAFQRNHYRIYQPNSKEANWSKRSANAKKKWFSEKRKQRKTQSIEYAWWKKFKSSLACAARLEARSAWDRRCASASSMLKKRQEPVFKLQKQFVLDWDAIIRDNRKRLRTDKRTKEQIEWSKKINHTVRACKRRLAARNKRDTGRFGMSITETQQGWLPFAE